MRNEGLTELDVLVGDWTLTMSDAWFLEPPGTEVHGVATVEWLGDAFVAVRSELDGELTREDPDFHQRFIASIERGRITGRWEA